MTAREAPLLALLRILAGFLVIWLVLDRSAAGLGSLRGEWGLVVAAATLLAAVVVELALFNGSPGSALRRLGIFKLPDWRAGVAVLVLSAALLGFVPIYAVLTATPLALIEGWPLLAAGIFLQAGLAEETLFRGYLFGHLREGRAFWAAALLSAIPFVAVHLLIFLSAEPAIAAASVLVALSMSFPLAWAYDQSGRSVWAVAVLHAVAQAGLKLVEVPPDRFLPLALSWMALTALAPWLLFLVRLPAR